MKKRLVTYLLVSALAAAVFAGCSKKDGGDAADAAATDATVVEEAAEDAGAAATASLEDVAAAAEAADAEEAGAVADTTVAAEVADEEVAAVEDESVTEFVDEEVKEDADKEDADKKDSEEAEVLVVDPGTTYTVRFGGNIYSSPEENAANVMYYANPGDYLTIVERLDNYWYKVSYYLAGEGIEHIGYIQIQ
jgi:hypothetical protein